MSRGYMLPSRSVEHETPRHVFDDLWGEFKFDLDPCVLSQHYTARIVLAGGGWVYMPLGSLGSIPYPLRFLDNIAEDGLHQPWHGNVFMNPPYPAGKWVAKAVSEIERPEGASIVVALLKVTTDVQWWHEYVEGKAEVRFIKGRLRFGDGKTPAPFPSCIVIWRRGTWAA